MVWSAAVRLALPTTTNNQAEYSGLITGLRAAHQHGWTDLEVVGDSALIIRQMSTYRPPQTQSLRRLYCEARQLGDRLDIRRWTHHVRAHNKMADLLANLAMNDEASSHALHPTSCRGHRDIRQHLGNDLRPWLATLCR